MFQNLTEEIVLFETLLVLLKGSFIEQIFWSNSRPL